VVDEMEELLRRKCPPDDSKALNEYVLNSDTRKFLRHMIHTSRQLAEAGHTFHFVTKRSCGFGDPDGWPAGANWFQKNLSKLKWAQECLLDGMTAPDPREVGHRRDPDLATPVQVGKALRWFLTQDHANFHPRFLVYCYHAVATFLKPEQRWFDPALAPRRAEFDAALRGSLQRALPKVRDADPKVAEAWQHLVERILFVAAWLRLDWMWGWREELPQESWLINEWEPKSKARLTHILQDIEKLSRALPRSPKNG
jgi:hypothetical protein